MSTAPRLHLRSPTWPPSLHLLPKSSSSPSKLIATQTKYTQHLPALAEDEDPFSHFLSPVLDDESDLFDIGDDKIAAAGIQPSYTAGIVPYNAESRSQRNELFKARLEEKWEGFMAKRLLQHPKASSSPRLSPPSSPLYPQAQTPPDEEALPDLLIENADEDIPSSPDDRHMLPPPAPNLIPWTIFPSVDQDMDDEDSVDGWEADRRSSQKAAFDIGARPTAKRPRLKAACTLSGKRHSWREPSVDLWTVDEEDENAMDEMERRGRRSKRRCKSVHWKEEVQVLEYER